MVAAPTQRGELDHAAVLGGPTELGFDRFASDARNWYAPSTRLSLKTCCDIVWQADSCALIRATSTSHTEPASLLGLRTASAGP